MRRRGVTRGSPVLRGWPPPPRACAAGCSARSRGDPPSPRWRPRGAAHQWEARRTRRGSQSTPARQRGPAVAGGSLVKSRRRKWASTPTTDCESKCRVGKGGTRFAELSPVTNNSDVQDSQKLGSVRLDAGSGTQD
eukprot:1194924-Prorocentrum_minimum.AAC.2